MSLVIRPKAEPRTNPGLCGWRLITRLGWAGKSFGHAPKQGLMPLAPTIPLHQVKERGGRLVRVACVGLYGLPKAKARRPTEVLLNQNHDVPGMKRAARCTLGDAMHDGTGGVSLQQRFNHVQRPIRSVHAQARLNFSDIVMDGYLARQCEPCDKPIRLWPSHTSKKPSAKTRWMLSAPIAWV